MRELAYNIWIEKADAAYAFNARSGSLLRLGNEDYRAFCAFLTDQTLGCSPRVLANLAAGLMLIEDDADEIAGLAKRYEAGRNNASRLALTVVTSLGCNFNCPYCFEDKHPSVMDEKVQELVLEVSKTRCHGSTACTSLGSVESRWSERSHCSRFPTGSCNAAMPAASLTMPTS